MERELTMLPDEERDWFNYTEFVEKHHITNDINSLSDEAIKEYIEDILTDYKSDMDHIYVVIADIVSDIVLISCLQKDNYYPLDNYVRCELYVKYNGPAYLLPICFGVKFDNKDERIEYLHKATKLIDLQKVEQIALDYINFKFHVFYGCSYRHKKQAVIDMIHKECTTDLIFRIFDDPGLNVYHQYINSMGFDTHDNLYKR